MSNVVPRSPSATPLLDGSVVVTGGNTSGTTVSGTTGTVSDVEIADSLPGGQQSIWTCWRSSSFETIDEDSGPARKEIETGSYGCSWFRLCRPQTLRERVLVMMVGCLICVACIVFGLLMAFSIFWQECASDLDGGPIGSFPPLTDFTPAAEGTYASFAVATDTPHCSRLAKQYIKSSGFNGVDAAVLTALCLGTVSPSSSGVGGGAVMLIRSTAETNAPVTVIDCRETAPAAANATMYVGNRQASRRGALAAAVPGLLQCLWRAHQMFGRASWQDVVTPVAQLAANFSVDEFLAESIATNQNSLRQDPVLAGMFFTADGQPKKQGDYVQWTNLSATLYTIAAEGIAPLYGGALGQQLAADVQAAGGIITAADMANYTALVHEPLTTFFSGYQLYSPPLPFGGAVMLMAFNVLERYMMPLTETTQHWMVEAWKFAYADRMALGDPAFVANASLDVAVMLDKQHAAALRQRLRADTTLPSPADYADLFPLTDAPEPHGTTHFSIVAPDLSVAMTSTINLAFGSQFVSPSTGILLNDEMDDFSTPGASNAFGYPPSEANFIEPGKRPMSSMVPTMVTQNGQLYLVVGGSGGSRIITATFQTIVNVLVAQFGAAQAVGAPRLHDQLLPDLLEYEAQYPVKRHSLFVGTDTLAQLGYNLTKIEPRSAVQLIIRNVHDNDPSKPLSLQAASDWRKYGQPAGE